MNDLPPAHWKCPDCGLLCRCTGAAQRLDHHRCGDVLPGSATQAALDDGVRRAYQDWQRHGVEPDGLDG